MNCQYIENIIQKNIEKLHNNENIYEENNKLLLAYNNKSNIDEKKEIAREIVLLNTAYIKFMTNKYTFDKNDWEDNFMAAIVGVYDAINHYDINMNIKFTTYSYFWIRKAILDDYVRRTYPFKIARHGGDVLYKISKYIEEWQLQQNTDTYPSTKEISKALGYSEKKVANYIPILQPLVYISAPIKNIEEEITLENILKDKTNIEDETIKKLTIEEVNDIIKDLCKKKKISERNCTILRLRTGYYGEPMTLEEIGKLYGLTKERVRKIEQAAIEKINFACQNRKLDMEGLFEYE